METDRSAPAPVSYASAGDAHPLLLAEAWYRLALVYHHHERNSPAIVRAAAAAAASAVRVSSAPHIEAVLLAHQTSLAVGEGKQAQAFLTMCENEVPGCMSRLESLRRGLSRGRTGGAQQPEQASDGGSGGGGRHVDEL